MSAGVRMQDSATRRTLVGRKRTSSVMDLGRDFQGLQVAGVDSNDLGAEGDCSIELWTVVDLAEDIQLELTGGPGESFQVVVVEGRRR